MDEYGKGPAGATGLVLTLQVVFVYIILLSCCRLLRDLHTVDANLEFWQNRLHQGSHLRFMLFGQGPLSFAHDVVSTLERKHKQRKTSATDKIERRVRIVTDHAVCNLFQ